MDVVQTQRNMARRSNNTTTADSNNNSSASLASGSGISSSASTAITSNTTTTSASPSAVIRRRFPPRLVPPRRRSHSSDEVLRNRLQRRRRHRLLEDHYCVVPASAYTGNEEGAVGGDPTNNNINNKKHKNANQQAQPAGGGAMVVLPGVPVHEEDWARDCHDFFNLVVLVPIVVLNVMNWNWDALLDLDNANHHHPKRIQDAWTGDWFFPFFCVTALYFLVDLIWVIVVPTCVKSPGTIVQHHLATMLYILLPLSHPEYQWCMGACMIVEVNTWFLIARRVFNKQGFPPWVIDLSCVSIRVKLISILFYLSWIAIRCLLYPYLMGSFYQIWVEHSIKVHTKWNLVMLCVPLHGIFCLLNLKWSYDLLMSKLRYFRRKGHYTKEMMSASKGL